MKKIVLSGIVITCLLIFGFLIKGSENDSDITLVNQEDINNDKETINIFETLTSISNYSIDPYSIVDLVENSFENLIIKIDREINTFMPSNYASPFTTYGVTIVENLNDNSNLQVGDKIEILQAGGYISLAEFEIADPERTGKMNLEQYNQEYKENNFLYFNSEDSFPMEANKEYIVMMVVDEEGRFQLIDGNGAMEVLNKEEVTNNESKII